jgi:large subunit ribosomal protein L14e
MFEIGRVCIKLLGRDAGKKCVVIDVIDHSFVMIDGETRRRKCNVKHLEPTDKILEVSKNTPRPEIIRVFKEMGIEIDEKPSKKDAKAAARPLRTRKRKEKPVKEEKAKAKVTKKKEPEMKKAAEEPESKPEAE